MSKRTNPHHSYRRLNRCCVAIVISLLCADCQSKSQFTIAKYAPIDETSPLLPEFAYFQNEVRPLELSPPPSLSAPKDVPPNVKITLECRLISMDASQFQNLGVELNESAHPITPDEANRIVQRAEQISAPSTNPLEPPRFTVLDGETVRAAICDWTVFVVDWHLGTCSPDSTSRPEPRIEALPSGISYRFCMRVDGSGVSFTKINPVILRIIGVRLCEAEIPFNDGSQRVEWREPVFLVAHPSLRNTRPIRQSKEDWLLVPMQYSTSQTTASVRAIAKGGRVFEKYVPSQDDKESPLQTATVILLHATIIPAPTIHPPGSLQSQ